MHRLRVNCFKRLEAFSVRDDSVKRGDIQSENYAGGGGREGEDKVVECMVGVQTNI